HRQILLDELRSKQGVDRIVSERVRGREQERSANAAYEPLGAVPLRTSIRTAGSKARPVVGALVGLDPGAVVLKRGREREAAVIRHHAADLPAAESVVGDLVYFGTVLQTPSERNLVDLSERPLLAWKIAAVA